MPSQAASYQGTNSQRAYHALVERFGRLSALEEAMGLLSWDRSVMMPKGGAGSRATTSAALATFHHDLLTDGQVGDWLDAASEEQDSLSPWEAANLHEMKRGYTHATALSSDLVEALSLAASDCEQTWRGARQESNFAAVEPKLTTLLGLVRQAASAKAEALGVSPYDALLDEYEPDGRSAEIDRLFTDLEGFLPDFLAQVIDRQGDAPPRAEGPFPIATQQAVCRQMMETLGFDFDHGRLDISAHPFCGGTPTDVRITTRYNEDDYYGALLGVIHETGHGLYERGLPQDWAGQPVGHARGMSLHESQSLMMEMQACRSREFMAYAAPVLAQAFNGSGPAWQGEALYKKAIRVERGYIRVDADEVTYPLHVILRYRLEKALIEGRMEAKDLPEAWNSQFQALIGVPVPNDRLGCLQDIHWYDGAWGYFPTYTLGAMTAAQLFASAVQAVPEIPEALSRGDFTPLLGWLRPNVHNLGSSLPTAELLTKATGAPLSTEAFKAHLKKRYLGD
jgi:carboxypeptidase Taq